ncbi:MAG TPA: xanthine dehydrogenase family protein molybdopterin-binding subunit, partial [Chthoniobacteraceae bacterium]
MPDLPLPPIGKPLDRADGRLKVTGGARYAAEFPEKNVAYAALVRSAIANGKITAIDSKSAENAPGVLGVFSHLHPLPWRDTDAFSADEKKRGSSAMSSRPLSSAEVLYNGQYVALVIAETLEQARHAAALVKVEYDATPPKKSLQPSVTNDSTPVCLNQEIARAETPEEVREHPPDRKRGDAEMAFAAAEVRFDQSYTTPWETHNPMEPHATLAVWNGDRLTVYDATQNVYGVRKMLAQAFEIPVGNVRVVCKFVGGAFGCKGLAWPHVPLAVAAAKAVQRPVKLALERRDMFTDVGYRSPTIQRVALGAGRDGKLSAIIHTGYSQSSIRDPYAEPFTDPTATMYATDHIHLSQKLVRLNVVRPTFMRAPGEVTGMFALESAMDELAHQLKIDPIELRLRNYAESSPLEQLPFSSKSLRECYARAAEKFGWKRRDPEPRAMRDGSLLVGLGMAGSTYPVNRSGAAVKLTLRADGTASAESATHDLGTGSYTVFGQLLAELLGLPVERVRFDLGDTDFPPAPVAGGSQSVNSVSAAIHAAVQAAGKQLSELARADAGSPLNGAAANEISFEGGRLFNKDDPQKSESFSALLARNGREKLEATADAKPGDEKKKYAMHAFGAHFCEVRVDPELATVRIVRWVAAHACGRVLNAKTTNSQIMGGAIMGIGMALM